MHHRLTRRAALAASFATGLPLLAGCSITTSGGTTTLTLDVARIVTDGHAIVSALTGVLGLPGIAPLLGVNLMAAQAALGAANLALTGIQQLTGGSISVGVDTSRLQGLVVSLLGDAATVLGLIQGALPALPSSQSALRTEIGTLIAAAQTLMPLVQLAAGLAGTAPAPSPMTEAQALAIATGRDGR